MRTSSHWTGGDGNVRAPMPTMAGNGCRGGQSDDWALVFVAVLRIVIALAKLGALSAVCLGDVKRILEKCWPNAIVHGQSFGYRAGCGSRIFLGCGGARPSRAMDGEKMAECRWWIRSS